MRIIVNARSEVKTLTSFLLIERHAGETHALGAFWMNILVVMQAAAAFRLKRFEEQFTARRMAEQYLRLYGI